MAALKATGLVSSSRRHRYLAHVHCRSDFLMTSIGHGAGHNAAPKRAEIEA